MTTTTTTTAQQAYADELSTRLQRLAALVAGGGLDEAIDLLTASVRAGGVVHAFGTGHSEAFAMEIAGRAGGLIPTHKIALRNVVLRGSRTIDDLVGASLERDGSVVTELLELTDTRAEDVVVIASNSGVNSSIVGMALAVQERGHRVIAVTSLEHTAGVEPKHPSGKRLSEVADVVIDNLAPYGDSTLDLGDGIGVGAVSSVTAAYIAQALTIGVVSRIIEAGETPPVYVSANVPGGDEHNRALEERYGDRISRTT